MTPTKTLEYYLSLPYPIVLIPDPEDGVWYAKIPMLVGCMADGATPVEALDALEEVKVLWFETSLKHGHAIPEPEPPGSWVVEVRWNADPQQAGAVG
jgi:antitoxin HicB